MSTMNNTSELQPKVTSSAWEIEVFFDGECPLCVREIKMLQRMDRKKRIVFTDIADTAFEPYDVGSDIKTLMAASKSVSEEEF